MGVIDLYHRLKKLEKIVGNTNNYTTEERQIGTWYGKPLYEKVVEVENTTIKGLNSFNHNIDNIKNIIDYEIYGVASSGNAAKFKLSYDGSYNLNGDYEFWGDLCNATMFRVHVGSEFASGGVYAYNKFRLICRYTKTTD